MINKVMTLWNFWVLFFLPTFGFAGTDPIAMEKQLSTQFGIFLLNEEYRSPQDKIVVTGTEDKGYLAEISYWHSLESRDPAQEICEAYRWILFGRGTYGKGASEAFKKYPTLQKIKLSLVDVEFETKKGTKKGEILPTSKPTKYLDLSIDRRSFSTKPANWDQLRDQMNKTTCAEIGTKYIDYRWFDQAYLRQGKKIQ